MLHTRTHVQIHKKTKSLKKTSYFALSTDSYTHHQIVLVLIIYRNPLKSLGDFSSFSRFGYFRFLHSFMFAIFFMSFNFLSAWFRSLLLYFSFFFLFLLWFTFLFGSLCRFSTVYRFDFVCWMNLYWRRRQQTQSKHIPNVVGG